MSASPDVDKSVHKEAIVDVSSAMLAFNWLPAAYAHREWLGVWADVLERRDSTNMWVIQSASHALLEEYGLQNRFLRDLGHSAWVIQPMEALNALADALGIVMLGGWVRLRLERTAVAHQLRVLGADRRAQALAHASTMLHLPYAHEQMGHDSISGGFTWGVPLEGSSCVTRLGLCCLAALLQESSSGARERFAFRFARGMLVPLDLNARQVDEAMAVIHRTMQSHI